MKNRSDRKVHKLEANWNDGLTLNAKFPNLAPIKATKSFNIVGDNNPLSKIYLNSNNKVLKKPPLTTYITLSNKKQFTTSKPGKQENTTYDTISRILGFQHHAGTNKDLELKVYKNIIARENILMNLKYLCQSYNQVNQSKNFNPSISNNGNRMKIMDTLTSLRDATVAYIESLTQWRMNVENYNPFQPRIFYWNELNYTIKLLNDLDFLSSDEFNELTDKIGIPRDKIESNPLMLPTTLLDQEPVDDPQQMAVSDTKGIDSGPIFEERLRIRKAERVLRQEYDSETLSASVSASASDADSLSMLSDYVSPNTYLKNRRVDNVLNAYSMSMSSYDSEGFNFSITSKTLDMSNQSLSQGQIHSSNQNNSKYTRVVLPIYMNDKTHLIEAFTATSNLSTSNNPQIKSLDSPSWLLEAQLQLELLKKNSGEILSSKSTNRLKKINQLNTNSMSKNNNFPSDSPPANVKHNKKLNWETEPTKLTSLTSNHITNTVSPSKQSILQEMKAMLVFNQLEQILTKFVPPAGFASTDTGPFCLAQSVFMIYNDDNSNSAIADDKDNFLNDKLRDSETVPIVGGSHPDFDDSTTKLSKLSSIPSKSPYLSYYTRYNNKITTQKHGKKVFSDNSLGNNSDGSSFILFSNSKFVSLLTENSSIITSDELDQLFQISFPVSIDLMLAGMCIFVLISQHELDQKLNNINWESFRSLCMNNQFDLLMAMDAFDPSSVPEYKLLAVSPYKSFIKQYLQSYLFLNQQVSNDTEIVEIAQSTITESIHTSSVGLLTPLQHIIYKLMRWIYMHLTKLSQKSDIAVKDSSANKFDKLRDSNSKPKIPGKSPYLASFPVQHPGPINDKINDKVHKPKEKKAVKALKPYDRTLPGPKSVEEVSKVVIRKSTSVSSTPSLLSPMPSLISSYSMSSNSRNNSNNPSPLPTTETFEYLPEKKTVRSSTNVSKDLTKDVVTEKAVVAHISDVSIPTSSTISALNNLFPVYSELIEPSIQNKDIFMYHHPILITLLSPVNPVDIQSSFSSTSLISLPMLLKQSSSFPSLPSYQDKSEQFESVDDKMNLDTYINVYLSNFISKRMRSEAAVSSNDKTVRVSNDSNQFSYANIDEIISILPFDHLLVKAYDIISSHEAIHTINVKEYIEFFIRLYLTFHESNKSAIGENNLDIDSLLKYFKPYHIDWWIDNLKAILLVQPKFSVKKYPVDKVIDNDPKHNKKAVKKDKPGKEDSKVVTNNNNLQNDEIIGVSISISKKHIHALIQEKFTVNAISNHPDEISGNTDKEISSKIDELLNNSENKDNAKEASDDLRSLASSSHDEDIHWLLEHGLATDNVLSHDLAPYKEFNQAELPYTDNGEFFSQILDSPDIRDIKENITDSTADDELNVENLMELPLESDELSSQVLDSPDIKHIIENITDSATDNELVLENLMELPLESDVLSSPVLDFPDIVQQIADSAAGEIEATVENLMEPPLESYELSSPVLDSPKIIEDTLQNITDSATGNEIIVENLNEPPPESDASLKSSLAKPSFQQPDADIAPSTSQIATGTSLISIDDILSVPVIETGQDRDIQDETVIEPLDINSVNRDSVLNNNSSEIVSVGDPSKENQMIDLEIASQQNLEATDMVQANLIEIEISSDIQNEVSVDIDEVNTDYNENTKQNAVDEVVLDELSLGVDADTVHIVSDANISVQVDNSIIEVSNNYPIDNDTQNLDSDVEIGAELRRTDYTMAIARSTTIGKSDEADLCKSDPNIKFEEVLNELVAPGSNEVIIDTLVTDSNLENSKSISSNKTTDYGNSEFEEISALSPTLNAINTSSIYSDDFDV